LRQEHEVSERRACGLIGVARSSCRYQPKEKDEKGVRAALRELALERPRFGYRRLGEMLRRRGWPMNHKRVYRLYRAEGLVMRRRKRKRVAAPRLPLGLPTRPQEMWTMDFTHDALVSGRKFRTLNLMDGYTRQALAIEVDTSLPGARVVRVLERLRLEHGAPERIQVDNGPEFISQVVDQWAYEHGVALHFIRPGKPTDNGRIESFNGKFRDECLRQFWFVNLVEARERIEAWRIDYNQVRPHSSLGYQTPQEFAAKMAATGCGKDAPWKPGKTPQAEFPPVPTALGNPAQTAGFPLSHSPGDGESPSAALVLTAKLIL
jgi:putative transposase